MFAGLSDEELDELKWRLRGAMLRFESPLDVKEEIACVYVAIVDEIWDRAVQPEMV